MRAVRVDSAKVSVSLPPLMACASVPNDASLAVDIQVTHQRCETLGPIEVERSDAHAVTLIVWLWRSSPGCGGEDVVSHHALQLAVGWAPGVYTFVQSPSIGNVLTVTRATSACSPTSDGGCTRTCDCAKGQVCVYDQGWDSGCIGTCQPACDSVYGCAGGGTAECPEDGSCAPGLTCKDGRCRWALSLGQNTRHACVRHADCGTSLRCVEGEDEQLGCEVPCNTANMACPGLHYCARDASYSSARWVCEWGGE